MFSKQYKTMFNDDWTNIHPWVRRVETDAASAYCTICRQKFALSNMGVRAVVSHAEGKKHVGRLKAQSSVFNLTHFYKSKIDASSTFSVPDSSAPNPSKVVAVNVDNEATDPALSRGRLCTCTCTCGTSSTQTSTLKKFLHKEVVIKAEVLACLNCVLSHSSLRQTADSIKLHRLMYNDSDIASAVQLSKSKVAYTIVHGLSPYFERELKQKIETCKHIVIGFDESLNKVAKKQQMDVNIRFWNMENDEVSTRYVTSVFLGHTTAADLLDAFKTALPKKDLERILQVSMDGPHVNFRFLKNLKEHLMDGRSEEGQIMDLGSCGLHTVHCAFKTGMSRTGWDLVPFLRALYNLFNCVPARRADYIRITGSELFPEKFCAIRWLENVKVVNRAIEMLPNLRKYIKSFEQSKMTAPKCHSFGLVENAVRDNLLGPKLAFFATTASDVEPFLREFQTDNPMAPFLYSVLTNLLKTVMERFVKSEILSKSDVQKLDLSNSENLLATKDVVLGYATKVAIRAQKSKDKDILLFRNDCRKHLISFVEKIRERSPLAYKLCKGISCFDPAIAACTDVANVRLSEVLEHFVTKHWLSGLAADAVDREYKRLCSFSNVQEQLRAYSRIDTRLDHFWRNLFRIYPTEYFTNLIEFFKMIMILSHGNAALERGFSVNKECLADNQHELSLIAQRRIYDSVTAAGGLTNFIVNTKLIHAARNAHSMYKEYMEQEKKQKAEQEMKKADSKRRANEIKELNSKKQKILASADIESKAIDFKIQALQK